jgi:hypothetical protein
MEDGDDQQTSRTILNKLLIAAVGFMLSSVFFVIKKDRRNQTSVTKSKIPMSDNLRIRKVDCKAELFFLLAFALLFPAGLSFAAVETNKMVSMQIESSKGGPVLRIVTEKPIADFAYTAYNSGDWSRVVIAFPHMNTGAISSLTDVNQPPVQKVDVLSDNTTWGRMSWVEVVLFKAADYDVAINYNEFVLTLLRSEEQANSAAVEPVANINESVPAPVKEVTAPASTIINVDVGSQVVTLQADGLVYNYKFFSLGGPDRLVLDVYGVKPGFEARSIPLLDDFSKMRVGVHKEKLRFVFDTSGKLPKYDVTRKGESVVISWGSGTSTISEPAEETKPASVVVPAPVKEVTTPASTFMNVYVEPQVVTLQADGLVDNYKVFSLGGPNRLVVDVYGVKPGFEARSIPLLDDFSKMRVGVYKEKLRFVFDTYGKLPKYDVTRKGKSVVISWGSGTSTISEPAEETKPASVVVPAPVKEVTALAFSEEYLSGKTLYAVWFDEGNSITNHAVVAKEVFNVDGTVDITYLSNLSDTTVAYGVTSAGLLFYGNNITEGNMITCSTVNYIKSDYTINGVFDSVDIYFFEEDRAVNFANTLSNSIPQGCL